MAVISNILDDNNRTFCASIRQGNLCTVSLLLFFRKETIISRSRFAAPQGRAKRQSNTGTLFPRFGLDSVPDFVLFWSYTFLERNHDETIAVSRRESTRHLRKANGQNIRKNKTVTIHVPRHAFFFFVDSRNTTKRPFLEHGSD